MPWAFVVTFLGGVITGVVAWSIAEIVLSVWEERE